MAWAPPAGATVGWTHVDVPSLGAQVTALGHGLLVAPSFSSIDAGATWSAGLPVFGPLVVDPRDPMRAIALPLDPWRATSDGGHTWYVVTRPRAPAGYAIPMSGFLFDPAHPARLVGVQQDLDLRRRFPAARSSLTLWVSDDAGGTWRSGADLADATVPVVVANPDGSDARVVTVTWAGTGGSLRQSFDDGATWSETPIDLEPPESAPRAAAGLLAAPASSSVLFMTTPTHVWRSGDGGVRWRPAAFPVAGEPALFASATHPGVVLALSGGRIWRSADDGTTFQVDGPAGAGATGGFTEDSDGTLYASGAAGVDASHDGGLTWRWSGVSGLPYADSTSGIVTAGANVFAGGAAGALRLVGGRFVSYAGRALELEPITAISGRDLVGIERGTSTQAIRRVALVRSSDRGATWQHAGSICENDYGTQLVPVPGTETVYAQGSSCTRRAAAEGQVTLARSDDRGHSWRVVRGTHLRSSLVPVPGSPDLLYSTTAGGDPVPTVSRDGGRSWHLLRFTGRPSAFPVDVLAATSHTLYVHGHTTGGHGATFTVRPDGRIVSTILHGGAVAASASNPDVAVAFLAYHRMRYTVDGGLRWRVLPSPPTLARYGCRGIALADDGRVVLPCDRGLWVTRPGAVG